MVTDPSSPTAIHPFLKKPRLLRPASPKSKNCFGDMLASFFKLHNRINNQRTA
jgi:hypothetical protein